MSSLYEYLPLKDLPDDTIRLLHIRPGAPCERIACFLSTAQLSLQSKFAALSYEWGSEPASKEIELNEKQVWIRKNLWQCLIRLRDLEEPLVIWIDAICVNQNDIPERNQQVKFMNHIFKTARPVFGWLGEDVGISVDAICPDFVDDLRRFDFARFDDLIKQYNKKDWQHTDTLPPLDDQEFKSKVIQLCSATTLLCQSHYWDRIWIVQEVLVAHDLILCYAGQRLSWTELRSWSSHMTPTQVWPSPNIASRTHKVIGKCSIAINRRLGDFARHHRACEDDYLHGIIARYGGRECSDVRDKVYALLGLITNRRFHCPQNHLSL